MSDFMKEVEKELDKQIAERFGNIAFVKAKSIEELQASAKRLCTKFDELKIQRNRLLQKVQELERYAKGTLCTECMYHTAWENENWDIVHWCKLHASRVAEDDFCSMGEHR